MCFLPNCRYHLILKGDIKELSQKSDAFCFNYQHVDCPYSFKYRFSGKIVVKIGHIFNIVQRAVHFHHQNRRVDRLRSTAKKRLWKKKYKKHLVSCCQETKSTQASGSVLADRIEQVKKTKFVLELMKIAEYFLDSHSKNTSYLVSLKVNFCKLTIF